MKPTLNIFFTVLTLLFSATTTMADEFRFSIVDGPELGPVRSICKPSHNQEFSRNVSELLEEVQQSVHCGHLEEALELIATSYDLVKQELTASKTPRGWCYEKRSCKGDLIYKSIITKSLCTAGDGKSWKQTSPKAGVCKRVN